MLRAEPLGAVAPTNISFRDGTLISRLISFDVGGEEHA